jgi:hypothetical protein
MPYRKISPETAEAILAANRTVPDPVAIPPLAYDMDGQLRVLILAKKRGDGRDNHWKRRGVAAGISELAEVTTRHPVQAGPVQDGPGNPVAAALVQLEDSVRERVTAVQFLGKATKKIINPTEPTPENGFFKGWEMWRIRLYRASHTLNLMVKQPLVLSDSAFDASGAVQLLIQGARHRGAWSVDVKVFRPGDGGIGEAVGGVRTEKVTHPGAPDDVVEATRQWIAAQLPDGIMVEHYRCLNRGNPSAERRLLAAGRMTLLREDSRTA